MIALSALHSLLWQAETHFTILEEHVFRGENLKKKLGCVIHNHTHSSWKVVTIVISDSKSPVPSAILVFLYFNWPSSALPWNVQSVLLLY